MNNHPQSLVETRFNRQSYLVLLVGIFFTALTLLVLLLKFAQPTDGWFYARTEDGLAETALFQGTGPTPLQVGDVVRQVNGETVELTASITIPLEMPLQMGQVVNYTVERNGQLQDVVVTLMPRTPMGILWVIADNARKNIASLVIPVFYLLIGSFVLWRQPQQAAAHYLFLFSVIWFGVVYGFTDFTIYQAHSPTWLVCINQFLGAAAWSWFVFPLLIRLMLVFPVEKGILRRFPRLLPTLLHGLPAAAALILLWQYSQARDTTYLSALQIINIIAILSFLLVMIGSLIHSFRTIKAPVARAQLYWFAFGMIGGIGMAALLYAFAVTVVTDPGLRNLLNKLIGWVALCLPVSLAIAIVRYRLFDIDILIRKTLQYSLLSGLLALVYFGGIVVLQGLFATLTGQNDNPLITVLSTLAIAALFLPLRRRVQDFIDKRFYRRKYDAAKVIADFAATARDETDLDALTTRLVEVVDETMQPESVGLWLKDFNAKPQRREGEKE